MPITDYLFYVAVGLEPLGVFLLSIEAIKLENIRKFMSGLASVYRVLNPRIVWTDEADVRPPLRKALGTLSLLLFAPIYAVLVTPMVVILYLTIGALNGIERHTPKGTIGVLGFVVWLLSFVINKALSDFPTPATLP